jgi:predicted Rossmann fold nucleotide-binding protein DprA/Smf involved in DNA uptake
MDLVRPAPHGQGRHPLEPHTLGQQAILQALAQQSKDLQQLAAETGLSEDAAKEALSILTIHDVVLRRPDDQCYGFRVELMRRWVLNTSAKQH